MFTLERITFRAAPKNHNPAPAKVETRRTTLQRRGSRLAWYSLARKLKQRLSQRQKREIVWLKAYAWLVVITLLSFLIVSIRFIVLRLPELAGDDPPAVIGLLGLCLAAGLAGSTVSALISVADRHAYGWELEDETKVPRGATKPDRFNQRMLPWFLIRPFLGAVMGLAVYLALSTGYFGGTGNITDSQGVASGFRITFFALLAGLFAKKFLDSLKNAFAAFVGANKDTMQESR